MISRRAFLGTGAVAAAVCGAAAVAHSTHRLDDFARAAGIKPRAEPAESDTQLVARVAHEQNALLGAVEATSVRHTALSPRLKPIAEIVQRQIEAVGGSNTVPATPADAYRDRAVQPLTKAFHTASKARAMDANTAVAPELVRVLASMSAGLAQCAKVVGDLR